MRPTGAVLPLTRCSSPLPLLLLLVVLGGRTAAASLQTPGDGSAAPIYTDRWAVQVRGGEHVARRLAAQHGYEFIAKVSRYYQLRHCHPMYFYTWGDSDVISMPVGFRRHLVGKTLRNVCHCDIAEIRFVGKLVIIQTFL